MNWRLFLQISFIFCFGPVGQAHAQSAESFRANPEIATGFSQKEAGTFQEFAAVTAHPLATKAANEMLARGGSAADAAIAAQLVLGLVEPQSSGLGGGGFALYYEADTKQLTTIDGRETAPSLAGPWMFQAGGQPMEFRDAQLGGLSVGVPGMPAMLEALHESYGKLTWMELFEPAVQLAREGFAVTPRLHQMIKAQEEFLLRFPETATYFMPGDKALQAGDILKNRPYEETLKDLAFYGMSWFYNGDLSDDIVSKVSSAGNQGLLIKHDMQNYNVIKRDPVCGPYRRYVVCSMGEPSSGGLTLLQILGMLERFDLSEESVQSWSFIAQASQLAFADRNYYMADPDFVETPGLHLLDPDYIKSRAAFIDPNKPLEVIEHGVPGSWAAAQSFGQDESIDQPGTTHISIVDKQGNIISLTSSIESAFGSHLMTNGFLLNNQLTDFSFADTDETGKPIANAPAGGKRPRSSMSPTIVFDWDGKPVLVIGSAGGSRIIGYVLQRIIAVLDWGMLVDEALAMRHVVARGETVEIEARDGAETLAAALKEKGFKTRIAEMNSGLTALHFLPGGTVRAAADPRREGSGTGK